MGDEEAQRAAEHKAAQLHRLGWQVGAGAAIWLRAVANELARHEAARESFGAKANREAWDRLHSTALLLAVAIDQVLSFERRVRQLTGDAELQRARERFDRVGPDAEAVRDLVVHLDDYATGTGQRQSPGAASPISEPYVETFIHWRTAAARSSIWPGIASTCARRPMRRSSSRRSWSECARST